MGDYTCYGDNKHVTVSLVRVTVHKYNVPIPNSLSCVSTIGGTLIHTVSWYKARLGTRYPSHFNMINQANYRVSVNNDRSVDSLSLSINRRKSTYMCELTISPEHHFIVYGYDAYVYDVIV